MSCLPLWTVVSVPKVPNSSFSMKFLESEILRLKITCGLNVSNADYHVRNMFETKATNRDNFLKTLLAACEQFLATEIPPA